MSTSKLLTKAELAKLSKTLPNWKLTKKDSVLVRTVTTEHPVPALAYCAKIIVHAEIQNHHPDIELSYGTVKLKLTTHDANGITKKDITLAKAIDKLEVC